MIEGNEYQALAARTINNDLSNKDKVLHALHGMADAEELLETCKKYNVDMKIYAFERGMEFNRDVEIVDGKILKDNVIEFTDYEWECVCPNMGG